MKMATVRKPAVKKSALRLKVDVSAVEDVLKEEKGTSEGDSSTGKATDTALSAAQRARIERNRLKARALQDSRLVHRPPTGESIQSCKIVAGRPLLDSGGGFLLEEEQEVAPPRRVDAPAPLVHPSEQPHCLLCDKPFPMSYLYDTFDYSVCDGCRDDDDAHTLITRTEAKSEYLLKDCDLDMRPPPLRCVRRRNPHRSTFSEMRLYLRVQVEERALEVWGSEEKLEAERAARTERAERGKQAATRRRLRALRMDVRSSLFDRTRPSHQHVFGDEEYDEQQDEYSRTCTSCGFRETYEKM